MQAIDIFLNCEFSNVNKYNDKKNENFTLKNTRYELYNVKKISRYIIKRYKYTELQIIIKLKRIDVF